MGQKIHPTGFRLAVSRNWSSRWYANSRDFSDMLNEDLKVRTYLRKRLRSASVARVLIERPSKNARITIFSARSRVHVAPEFHGGGELSVFREAWNRKGSGPPKTRTRTACGDSRRTSHVAVADRARSR